jgi:sec-independent protein translocase protein TatA
MPFRIGPTELIILLIIVILLFGVGRIGRLGADLGKAISVFRKNVSKDDSTKAQKE